MEYQDVLLTIGRLLEKQGIDYFVTGSLAISVYGRPRSSHDFDFKVVVIPQKKDNFSSFLNDLPNDFSFDKESLLQAAAENYQHNIFYLPENLKIDLWFGINRPLDKICFQRKIKQTIAGKKIYFISPEDLILIKLDWYKKSHSDRHLEDAASVFQIQKNLDQKYLFLWAKKLKLTRFLKTLKSFPLQQW
ncbi:hypothetical protein HY030_00925 [Candidatus Gottesmanbacteria bacterium]|nr:hypothetical protein [Candidatus Gottesmanbacteria bacterium]